ncbi:MAG: methenyltetrahydromethanopterin cyclohydrolase [Promethearchaeota archaeon]
MLSVNIEALKIAKNMIKNAEQLNIDVQELDNGATVIDAGVQALGGLEAGVLIGKICLGGLGGVSLFSYWLDDILLPAVNVYTDQPIVACLGSQFAGWRISVGDYFVMGSGPARALAQVEEKLFTEIGYADNADSAVIVLETRTLPNSEVMQFIADKCNVDASETYAIVAPTASISGSAQIAARIVETGIHKITEVGLDYDRILHGFGSCPIVPVEKKDSKAMGTTNDAILLAGSVVLGVRSKEEDELKSMIDQTPSSASRDYGRPFYEIFKSVGGDFYKIDPGIFAPALIVVNDVRTGTTYKAGRINSEMLKKSLGFKE